MLTPCYRIINSIKNNADQLKYFSGGTIKINVRGKENNEYKGFYDKLKVGISMYLVFKFR